ncbi:16747_t:CDS:2 [Funneliformis geosporum]|nr:16747_t:CDS:2 [Funneliformis geosporum]
MEYEKYVTSLKEVLSNGKVSKNLSATKFFKENYFTFSQRKMAEEILLETLRMAKEKAKTQTAQVVLQEKEVSYLRSGKRQGEELPSTPPNKTRAINTETSPEFSSDSDSEFWTSIMLTNVFLDSTYSQQKTPIDTNAIDSSQSSKVESQKTTRKYINRDLADEVLKSYQMQVMPGDKLIYDNVDVLKFACSKMKKTDISNSPLSIGVLNIHNNSCTKFLPINFKQFISDQIQDCEAKAVYFTENRSINKFMVDCEEDVLNFLEEFQDIRDLESLAKCLNENPINMSTASNDLIFARILFDHFYFLFKNDTLLQPIFKAKLRRACIKSYEKLKEILNVAGRGGPKLDGKGFLKSLGTEIIAQEDGVLNTFVKRKVDLQKLEYCSKVILTALYFALPSTTKSSIADIEIYTLQSNEFRLKISASKYLFENIIITMDLQHIEIPRTVEGFSKLIVGVKTILSWKARTKKNTMKFYEALNKGHKRLTNGAFFSPVKISI